MTSTSQSGGSVADRCGKRRNGLFSFNGTQQTRYETAVGTVNELDRHGRVYSFAGWLERCTGSIQAMHAYH